MHNENKNLFQMGEVTRALGITRRMLINYEDLGLVKPAFKDGNRGFRYYSTDNIVHIPGVRHLCSPKRSSLTLQPIGKWAFFMKLFVKFEYFLCCNCCIFILNVI